MQAEDDAEASSKRHKQPHITDAVYGPINLFLEEASSADKLTSTRRVVYYPEEPRISRQWLDRFQIWAAPEFWDLPTVAARCTFKPHRVVFQASPTTMAAINAHERLLAFGFEDSLPCLLPPGIHRLVVDYLCVEIWARVVRAVSPRPLRISEMEDITERPAGWRLSQNSVSTSVWKFSLWRGKIDALI